mgnify:CR=1 FL=1
MERVEGGSRLYAVTTSDSADLTNGPCKGLYIGVAGDVKVTPAGAHKDAPEASGVVLKAVPVGYLPFAVRRVWATGTAATDIVAVYP